MLELSLKQERDCLRKSQLWRAGRKPYSLQIAKSVAPTGLNKSDAHTILDAQYWFHFHCTLQRHFDFFNISDMGGKQIATLFPFSASCCGKQKNLENVCSKAVLLVTVPCQRRLSQWVQCLAEQDIYPRHQRLFHWWKFFTSRPQCLVALAASGRCWDFSEEGICPIPADGRTCPLGPDCHLHGEMPLPWAAWVFTLVLFPVMRMSVWKGNTGKKNV